VAGSKGAQEGQGAAKEEGGGATEGGRELRWGGAEERGCARKCVGEGGEEDQGA
jgi:hypothetical protein